MNRVEYAVMLHNKSYRLYHEVERLKVKLGSLQPHSDKYVEIQTQIDEKKKLADEIYDEAVLMDELNTGRAK